MPQYLVAIHHPDNYNPSLESEEMIRDIDVLNEEMAAWRELRSAAWPSHLRYVVGLLAKGAEQSDGGRRRS
jgi:hypothetical protein